MKKQGNRLVTIIGIILCVLLLPILIINITLITKSYTNKDDVPSVMGYYPMIVLTDSMNPVIKSGDLIIGKVVSASDIKKNDIISFFDPDGDGNSVVTHRVVEILNDGGNLQFRTKGDANNTFDNLLVDSSDVVGVYSTKISGAGNVAMFMSSTTGLIVCVLVPIIILIIVDVVRRKKYEQALKNDTDELMAELKRLKAEKANKGK